MITEIHAPSIEACLKIADYQLGEKCLSEKDFVSQDDQKPIRAIIDTRPGGVTGFAIGQIFETPDFLQQHPKIHKAVPMAAFRQKRVGLVSAVAVAATDQRQGLGTGLIQNMLAYFEAMEVRHILMIGKRQGTTNPIAGIARALGFRASTLQIQEYWQEQGVQRPCRCTLCVQSPCRCSAVIYQKWI